MRKNKKHDIWENKDGDMLEVRLGEECEEGEYGQWLCPYLVVHRRREDDKIIGFHVEGIRYLLKKAEESEKKELTTEQKKEKEKLLKEFEKDGYKMVKKENND